MKLWTNKDYDPKKWVTKFAFFPKAMSNGDVIWLEHYKQRAIVWGFNDFGFHWEYRRIK